MKKYKKSKNFKGFSLIELLIVVVVIGLLASIAVNAYNRYRVKVLIAQAMKAAEPLQKSIEMYFQVNNIVPGACDLGSAVPEGYSTGCQPLVLNPITNVAQIKYFNTNYCSVGAQYCDYTGSGVGPQIEITFSNPTSVGSGYISGGIFMLVPNIGSNKSGFGWLCMPYPDKNSPTFDVTLLPSGCHNASLDH